MKRYLLLGSLLLAYSCGDEKAKQEQFGVDLKEQKLPLSKASEPKEIKVEIQIKDERKKDKVQENLSLNEGSKAVMPSLLSQGQQQPMARKEVPSYCQGEKMAQAPMCSQYFTGGAGSVGPIADGGAPLPGAGGLAPGFNWPGFAWPGIGVGGPLVPGVPFFEDIVVLDDDYYDGDYYGDHDDDDGGCHDDCRDDCDHGDHGDDGDHDDRRHCKKVCKKKCDGHGDHDDRDDHDHGKTNSKHKKHKAKKNRK